MNIEKGTKIDKIVNDLRKVNRGEIGGEEAKKLFQDLNPLQISLAEQRLLDEGMDPDMLRKYCDLHLQAMEEKKEKLQNNLPEDNPIRIAINEHDKILEFLSQLEKIAEGIQRGEEPDQFSKQLAFISEQLVDAEKHHEREEEVLFPLLEGKDITGPPGIMREDHERLWPKKLRLKELAGNLDTKEDFSDEVELVDLSFELIQELRDHIYKENNILYPTVVENVEGSQEWAEISEGFDEIGYCSFTFQEN